MATTENPQNPADQQDPDELSKKEFEEQQRGMAQDQNLTNPNAVPEQRPQSFLRNEGDQDSDLTKQLRKGGALPEDDKPMPHSAFKKAGSDAQMKRAAKDSKSEGIHVGNGVQATAGPHEGRIFAVTRVTKHGSAGDALRTSLGDPQQLYNSPAGLELRAIGDERDGELVVLEDDDLDDAELVKLGDAFHGTRAGRRH